MKNYIINVDRLQITFNNHHIKLIDKSDYKIEYILPTDKQIYSYLSNYTIRVYYKNIPFLIILHQLKSNFNYSSIKILNDRLYIKNWDFVVETFLNTYKITDWNYSQLEIAINTNKVITTKYLNLYKKDKINFKDNHSNISPREFSRKDIGDTDDHKTNDFSKRTFYIYKKNKRKDEREKELRIEDKTNEVRSKSNKKQYILDYYYRNGLDSTKNIYRVELILNIKLLKKVPSNIKHRELKNSTNIITNYRYKQLNKAEKQNYSTIKYVRDYKSSIPLSSLTDEVYLTKLFNTFVMIDYDTLIKLSTNETIDFQFKIWSETQQTIKEIEPEPELSYIKRTELDFEKCFL